MIQKGNILEKLLIIFPDKEWNYYHLASNLNINMKIIERYHSYKNWNWTKLNSKVYLTKEFVEKYQNQLDWYHLAKNPVLTQDLIIKYLPKIKQITKYKKFRINQSISLNPNIFSKNFEETKNFILKYQDELLWYNMFINSGFTLEYLDYFLKNEIIKNIDWMSLSQNPNLTLDFIEKNINANWDWECLSDLPILTLDFIEKNLDKINWEYVSYNPNLTYDFIIKYQNRLDWFHLSKKLNLDIIKKIIASYENLIEWDYLTQNHNLTQEFIIKYQDYFDLEVLLANPATNLNVIEYFINKEKIKEIKYFINKENEEENKENKENEEENKENEEENKENEEENKENEEENKENEEENKENEEENKEKIKENKKINWHLISRNPNITIEFIIRYQDKIDFDQLLFNKFQKTPFLMKKRASTLQKKYFEIWLYKTIRNGSEKIFWKNEYSASVDLLKLKIRD